MNEHSGEQASHRSSVRRGRQESSVFVQEQGRRQREQKSSSAPPGREPMVYDDREILPLLPEADQGRQAQVRSRPHPSTSSSTSSWDSPIRVVSFVFLASLLGLAIGITLAILLASGELDLSIKDVKLFFKALTF